MSEEKLITLDAVGCSYSVRKGFLRSGTYEALKGVSFEICRGETIGVIGKNGAGKSTLLRLVAGVILPDSGRIIRHVPASISLLTLQLGFSPELTGRDNAIFGAMLLGHSHAESRAKLQDIKDFSELGDWFEEPIKVYSAGMRARLGFSIAMEMTPDILLIDEVLGVGDAEFRKKSSKALKEKMMSGQTVLYVSHSIPSIKELCSHVVWVEDGLTKMEGPTAEVLHEFSKA